VRDITTFSFGVEAGKTARAIEDGEPPVRVFMHPHGGPDIVLPMALGRNLEAASLVGDAIVGANHPILLQAQHVGERAALIGHEGRAGLGRRHREAGIVVGNEAFLEEAVGGRRFCRVPNTRSIRPRPCGE
jgi:hypothetical protein